LRYLPEEEAEDTAMLKIFGVGLSVALTAVIACGPGGVSEGGECGGSQDDCSGNLTCTPINGRGHSYCCPTPSEASNYQTCHPMGSVDHTPQ
jgi:hypothetical protein